MLLVGLGCSAISAVLGTRLAHATVARRLTLRELVAGTCHIVAGAPMLASSRWETIGTTRRIVTEWVVRVDESIDDRDAPGEVLVRTLGGVVGDVGQVVAGQAHLQVGQRAALFLCEPSPEVHAVFGWAQGAYPLRRDRGGTERLHARPGDVVLVGPKVAVGAVRRLDRLSLADARRAIIRERSERGR
jgi:hypothetical protein